jgi:general secretion pathway protein M
MRSLSLQSLSPRAQRALAAGLAIFTILLAVAMIAVPAVWLHHRYDDEIERLERQYRAYQRAFLARPATLERLEAVTAQEGARFYLKAANASLATAEVQDKVSAIFNGNGARILTTQVPPPREEGRFKQIIVNFQGYANAPNLRKMLHALESAEPKLFLDNFSVRSQVPFNYRGQPGVEPDMYVTFDVIAYLPQVPPEARPPDGKGDAKAEPKADAKSVAGGASSSVSGQFPPRGAAAPVTPSGAPAASSYPTPASNPGTQPNKPEGSRRGS